jgi:ADP-heptose:LPS heptosyltransferase
MNAFTRKINGWRGDIMRGLTRNIGLSYQNSTANLKNGSEIRSILVSRPNHRLGNLLLITPLLQEIKEVFPHAKVDLFVKGNLPSLIFKNYDNVDRVIQLPRKPFKKLFAYAGGWLALKKRNYDLAINVVYDSSSGRLSVRYANSRLKFFGDRGATVESGYDDFEHMGKYPVYCFRDSLTKIGFTAGKSGVPSLQIKLNPKEIARGKRDLYEIVRNIKKTICIFTYATDIKCYSREWWEEFYERLRKEFPDFNIIEILPVENVSQISFKAPSYYSKNIREIGSVIANTSLFIGADSGMMHLASASGTPTVGLFKITKHKIYEPYNKNSMAINTSECSIGDCIEKIAQIPIRVPVSI